MGSKQVLYIKRNVIKVGRYVFQTRIVEQEEDSPSFSTKEFPVLEATSPNCQLIL